MRRSIAVVVLSLALSACGGSSSDEAAPSSTSEPAAEAREEPVPGPDDAASTEPPASGADVPTRPEPEPADDAPATEPSPAVEEPAPEPEVLWPDDGCSADNSPTPAAAAEGPAPAIGLRPESVDGPLPDLAVRRINCKGGWENLRNELPADRPVLVWFWAPH